MCLYTLVLSSCIVICSFRFCWHGLSLRGSVLCVPYPLLCFYSVFTFCLFPLFCDYTMFPFLLFGILCLVEILIHFCVSFVLVSCFVCSMAFRVPLVSCFTPFLLYSFHVLSFLHYFGFYFHSLCITIHFVFPVHFMLLLWSCNSTCSHYFADFSVDLISIAFLSDFFWVFYC